MPSSYKSSIGISIVLDPQNKIKGDLEQLLNKLSQTSKINININPQINQQLKEVSENLSNIYSQTNKPFALNSLTKSAEESAKVFQSIGDEIGKLHEKSDFKINTKNSLQEAKEVNRVLKENYDDEVKLANQIQNEWDKVYKERLNSEQKTLSQIQANEKKAYDDEILRLGEKAIAKQRANENLANQIANGREKAELKSQQVDRSQELAQAKSINKVLEDNYKAEIKEAEAQRQVQQEIQKQIKLLELRKQSLNRQYGDKIDTSYIDDSINKLKSMNNVSMKGLKSEISSIEIGIKEITEQAKSSEGVFGKLGNSLRNVGIYIDITDVVRGVSNEIKEGVGTVIKMDSALGNLNKVVSMTSSQLLQMRDNAIAMGQELGRSSIEVANAQAEFGRLYKTQNEINDMTKVSVMGANVMDGVTSAEVAKGLTTVITSMKLEAKDSMNILDSMNEIQNNYRVGANDLLNALAEVGSTAYTSGTNLKQVEGYITSIAVATGKSGDEIGNSLKSIMSRVYKLGKDGLESEGKPEQMLKEMGVAVRDSAGNFRDFSTILGDLDVKWQKMSNTERIATAQVVAGVHRYNDFMSLMNNYQMAVDSTNTALNSQGSALKENEIHMQTAEAKLGTLKATTEAFYMKLINSDAIKSGIDGLTKLIEIFGNLPTVIGLTSAAIMAFGGKAIVSGISSVGGYITSLISLASTEGIVATATGELTLAMSTNPFGLIAVAIASVTVGLVALGHAFEESTDYIGKMNEATKGLQELKSTENLVNQYNDLNAIINNTSSTVEQVTTAKEKLLSVQKQLAAQNPDLVDGYTKEGDALVRNIKLIEEKVTKDKKALLSQANSNYDSLIKQINSIANYDTAKNDKWYSGLFIQYDTELNEYNELINKHTTLTAVQKKELSDLSAKFGDLNKAIITMRDNGQDISGKQMFDFSTGKLVDAKQYLKDIEEQSIQTSNKTEVISKAMKELNSDTGVSSTTIEKLNQLYPDMSVNASNAKDKIQSLNNELNNTNANGVEDQAKAVKQATEEYQKSTQAIAKAQGFIDKLNKSQAVTPQLAGQISKTYGDITTQINSYGSTIDFLKGKIQEQQEAQQNSLMILKGDDADFYQQKIANNENYENQINDFLARFNSNSQNAYDVDLSQFTTLNQMKAGVQGNLKSAVDSFLSQFVDTSSSAYSVDYNNFTNLMSAKAELLKQMAGSMASFWDETAQAFNGQAFGGVDLSGHASDATYQAYQQKAQGILDLGTKIKGAMGKLDGIYAGGGLNFQGFGGGGGTSDFSGTGGSGGSGGKSKAESEAEKAQKLAEEIAKMQSDIKPDRYLDLNNAIKQVDNSLSENKTLKDTLKKDSPEYQNALEKDIKLYKDKQIALDALNKEQIKERDELKAKLASYDFEFDKTGKLINSQQKLMELQTNINNMGGNTEADKEKKKEYIDWLKEVNDEIKQYGELAGDKIPKTTELWNEQTNEIKKLNEEMKETLGNFRDKVAGYILEDLQEKQKKAEEDLESAEKKKKKALEDAKKAKADELDAQIKALQDQIKALDDESADNEKKLAKLKAEKSAWMRDDSVFAKSKIADLDEKIKETEKTIKKDNLNKQIDKLQDEKDKSDKEYDKKLSDLDDYYEKKKTKQKNSDNDAKLEEKAYEKADKLLKGNHQKEILDLMSKYGKSYKEVGKLLGENFKEGWIAQIEQAKKEYSDLMGNLTGTKTDSTSSSNTLSGSNDDGSGVKTYTGTTSTGKSYTINSDGVITNISEPLYEYEEEEAKKHIPRFKTGGRTRDLGVDGKFVIADSNEMIANANDTKKFDEMYNYIKNSGSLINQLSNTYANPNSYSLPNLVGTNLNGIASNVTNNSSNTNTSSVSMPITIINQKGAEQITTKEIKKIFKETMKEEMRTYK